MAPSGQMTAAGLDALLKDGTLTGEWAVDPRRFQHPTEEQEPARSGPCKRRLRRGQRERHRLPGRRSDWGPHRDRSVN